MLPALLLPVLILLATPTITAAAANTTFPRVTGSSLEKRKLELPRDFEGEVNLVIVAFAREQQHDADTWIAEAKRLEKSDPTFHYYELPITSRSNPLFRWWLDSAMRRLIDDPGARQRTITLYLDKKSFKNDLHISDERKIHVFLVKKDGTVFWQSEGPASGTKLEFMRIALKTSQPGH